MTIASEPPTAAPDDGRALGTAHPRRRRRLLARSGPADPALRRTDPLRLTRPAEPAAEPPANLQPQPVALAGDDVVRLRLPTAQPGRRRRAAHDAEDVA